MSLDVANWKKTAKCVRWVAKPQLQHSAKENCQAQSSSGFRFAEQTDLASFSIDPTTQPTWEAYYSVAANKISIVEQSRQPQPKLATQSHHDIDLWTLQDCPPRCTSFFHQASHCDTPSWACFHLLSGPTKHTYSWFTWAKAYWSTFVTFNFIFCCLILLWFYQ